MPRLRNAVTGVVVNVSDEKAERLGSGWVGLDQPAAGSDVAPSGVTSPEAPAGNASQEVWADWVVASNPDLDEAEVRAMTRNDLREKYGPKPE